ncbi:MAG: glycosyltransferase [Campylobacteraceae bacterium]|nr:glycosyltransferase [Campylobacteraceae bacterium]
MNKNLLIIFVKEPKKGFVKTRLANKLGDEFVLELYKCFVKDLLVNVESKNYDIKMYVTGSKEKTQKIFNFSCVFSQVDGNLGLKMKTAFMNEFEFYEKVVLIGSDTPHIRHSFINEAFLKLNTKEIVLGPADDGGYYLIAFNKTSFNKNVFENISWSSPMVFTQTLQKLNVKKLALLENLNDIDDSEDLQRFYDEFKHNDFMLDHTLHYLKESTSWKNLT